MPKPKKRPAREPADRISTNQPLALDDFRILSLVFSAGGIGQAAAALNLTRAALEQKVMRLEKALGVGLLDRSAGEATVTLQAQRLLEAVDRGYAAISLAISDFRAEAKVTHSRGPGAVAHLPSQQPIDLSKIADSWEQLDRQLGISGGKRGSAADRLLKKFPFFDSIGGSNIAESAVSTEKLVEFSKRVIAALASGKSLTIPASQMPTVSIPEKLHGILAEHLANEIARAAAGEDLEGPTTQKPSRLRTPKASGSHVERVLQTAVDVRPVPTRAPARWKKHRLADESVPDFVKRHYKVWLGHGLHRGHIRKLDPELYEALRNYLRSHALPEDCPLPTVKEFNDQLTGALFGDSATVLDSPGGGEVLRKLFSTLASRRQRTNRNR